MSGISRYFSTETLRSFSYDYGRKAMRIDPTGGAGIALGSASVAAAGICFCKIGYTRFNKAQDYKDKFKALGMMGIGAVAATAGTITALSTVWEMIGKYRSQNLCETVLSNGSNLNEDKSVDEKNGYPILPPLEKGTHYQVVDSRMRIMDSDPFDFVCVADITDSSLDILQKQSKHMQVEQNLFRFVGRPNHQDNYVYIQLQKV